MLKGFQKLQYQFAAHLRDPQKNPPPAGLDDRRLAIYRNLFFNNANRFIENAFPVLRRFYDEENWKTLIRSFYASHQSHSPYFGELPREFLDYLQNEYRPTSDDPPFMNELAHYEWIELALARDETQIDLSEITPDGDLLRERPALSPLARRLAYRWPVHRISPDFRPERPGDHKTHLVVCRRLDDRITFVHVTPQTDLLLEEISRHPGNNGQEHLGRLAGRLQLPDPDAAIEGGLQALQALRRQDIILGTWKAGQHPQETLPGLPQSNGSGLPQT